MPSGEEKPVGFASRTLTKAEKNYSHLDKEALAILYGVRKFHQYLHGRTFQIKTDHKPLTHLFNESRAISVMASGRIQRWTLILGGYDYTIQYREGKYMANADALSHLPLESPEAEVPRPPELVHVVEHMDSTHLSCSQIRRWTDHDPTLSRVRKWVQEGWPAQEQSNDLNLQSYVRRKDELSTEGGCVLWGSRVIVPTKGRRRALEMLHEAHPGIVRMKSLARGYMWWPGMDSEIESCVKQCTDCQMSRKEPPVPPLHPSDNASTFTSEEFAEFLRLNGIRHVRSPPYHSASNGLIESAVQTFKEGMRHQKSGTLNTRHSRFLQRCRCRITPHSSTGTSPSELMWGRKLRSTLDLLVPDVNRKVQQNQDHQK